MLLTQTRLILRNDLRLLWRELRTSKARVFTSITLFAVIMVVAHALSLMLFFKLKHFPPINIEAGVWAFFGFLMLGSAMNHAISLFFERADFDLLLSSPIQPRAVLLSRITVMMLSAALGAGFFILPLLDGIVIGFSWRYAAGYVVWAMLALIVSSLGVWATLGLVRWLGPRRARVWVQIMAAVLGAGIYITFQVQNYISPAQREAFLAGFVATLKLLGLHVVAEAGRGGWWQLLTLGGVSGLLAFLTARQLSRVFLNGLQEATTKANKPAAKSKRPYTFQSSVGWVTFKKDLRLIVRDPLLLSQILPSLMYIVPVFFGLHRFGIVTVLAPIAVVIAVQFSTQLSDVAASGEECLDLMLMSPVPEVRLRVAKMAAGMALPVSVSFIICAVIVFMGRPFLAALVLIVATATAAGCSWLYVTQITPTARKDILSRRRERKSIGRSIAIGTLLLLGSFGVSLISRDQWLLGLALLGADTLGLIACFVLVTPAVHETTAPSSKWNSPSATT